MGKSMPKMGNMTSSKKPTMPSRFSKPVAGTLTKGKGNPMKKIRSSSKNMGGGTAT